MLLKSLMKNPILVVGILMMAVFLMTVGRKEGLFRREALMPTSCKAVRVKLDRRIPANWSSECDGNNLSITMNFAEPKDQPIPEKELRATLYRTLANNLKSIALNSPSDNLERTDIVSARLIHPRITINAVSEGKYIVKLATMNDPKMIAEHLKVTVQIQEVQAKP